VEANVKTNPHGIQVPTHHDIMVQKFLTFN